jgi:hypothetical protein
MTEQIIVGYQKQQKSVLLLQAFGFCFPIFAVMVACYISFFGEMPIAIEKPAILTLASFFMLALFKSEPLNTLQKIMLFYLVSVPVNSFLPVNIRASYSTVVLLLCSIGYLVGRVNSTNRLKSDRRTNILYGWVLALVIIIIHMVLLTLILSRFYDFGYERNFSTLGNLCLYFLLFIVLWENLNKVRFRQGIGLILAVFYLAVIIAKR